MERRPQQPSPHPDARGERIRQHVCKVEAADRRRDAARERLLRSDAARMGLDLMERGGFYALVDHKTGQVVSGTVGAARYIYNLDEIEAVFRDWRRRRRRRRPPAPLGP